MLGRGLGFTMATEEAIIRIPPYHYIHVLDQNSNVSRVEVGPKTYIRQDNERVLFAPVRMVTVPPRHYCIVANPVSRDAQSSVLFDVTGQVRLRHADQEIRLAQDPFPLYPGELLEKDITPLQVVLPNTALHLKALLDFEDKNGDKVMAGDEWLFEGPGTYIPQKEVEVVEIIQATVIKQNQALRLRARKECFDRDGKERVTGEEWLVRSVGAYLPAVFEEVLDLVDAVILTEKTALHLRARQNFKDLRGVAHRTGEEWLVTVQDTEAHVPDVYEEVLGVVPITTLGPRHYCVILDPMGPDGKNQLGQKRVVKGEKSFFLQPGERLERGIQDVYVLSEQQGLLLKALQPLEEGEGEEKVAHQAGDRWLIRGPLEYVPSAKVEVVEERQAIPLDQNEGIYVQDVKTGKVRAVIGSTYMLTQDEVLWEKELPSGVEELLNLGHDPLADRGQKGTAKVLQPSAARNKTRVVSYRVPHNAAVQVYDYRAKRARVVFGPELVSLDPEEQFTVLSLSAGRPKRPHARRALCLLLGPDFFTDVITIETADHARLQLQLAYNWHFELKNRNDPALVRYFANEPFADFHRVEGLQGVYIATLINGSMNEENMRSVITFDKGGTWEFLQAPAFTGYGEKINCELSQGCSLHLAQRLSQLLNLQLRRMPILSKESAPGLIIATGSVGKNLASKTNVYISSSAGARWREALPGPHYYTWGDHGGIIMAIAQGMETNELKYSTNEGETWKTFVFSEKPVFVYGLLTEPGEKSTVFTIFGSNKESVHSWLILQVNATDALGVPCTENDYKLWSPSDERGNECLLGHKTVFKRRTPHATCFNGEDFDRPVVVSNCSCTREDYECDFGFKMSEDLSLEVCVPDPEFSGKPYSPPVPCPVGSSYRRTRGYRKISGDTCSGGDVEARLEGELVPCPLAEENEFILYAMRKSIYRYDLASGATEQLPLSGLRAAVALDFDYERNCLYWSDLALDTIQRLCLNGSTGQEVIINSGLETVEALAFEPLSQLLYWVDAGFKKIEVANPDGDFRLTIVNSSVLDRPRALVLVPQEGVMFWTDWGDLKPGIYRSYMDGSAAYRLVSEDVKWPNGISVDSQWIYWTDAYLDCIERITFSGQQRSVILDSLPHPYAIAVFKNEIYWDDWSQLSIFRASKHSRSQVEILASQLTGLMDMKVFYKGKNAGSNACVPQPCSLLCLPKANNSKSCRCPEGVASSVLPSGDLMCDCPQGYQRKNNTCVKEENTCLRNQYRCSNGNCINSIWWCDFDNDCGDMSDERNCPTTVCDADTQFRCQESGTCIPLSYKCDLEDDCGDNSDESHCEMHQCRSDEFNCSSGMCIRSSWVCDGDNDCRDWSDEANCTAIYHTCEASNFQCHNGHCIPQRWACDGDADCQDGSDEDPVSCEKKCNGFHCPNGTCIPSSKHCDGLRDCPDGSDEQHCEPFCTRFMDFVCKNRQQCLFHSMVCDGIVQCRDGSDEDAAFAGCSQDPEFHKECDEFGFQCQNGVCISLIWKCDGMDDCGDYSDEANCENPTEAPNCSRYFQFHCENGHCIPNRWKCDRENDCGDWSDEKDCGDSHVLPSPTPGPSTCLPNYFHCSSGACVMGTWVCDGYRDCADGSDEEACPSLANSTAASTPTQFGQCDRFEFECHQPKKCIPNWKRCDGHQDCQDGQDEANCPTHSTLTCTSREFKCEDGEACIVLSERCDGFLDCSDESDEKACSDELTVYKVQNLQWTADFSGDVTLTWMRPKKMPSASCVYNVYYRVVGESIWKTLETHSNKTSTVLKVLKPDTTYQVKVQVHCLNKVHNTNDFVTLRTPEGLPDAPRNLQLSLNSEEEGVILGHWAPPVHTHGLIREYIVEYSRSGSKMWASQRAASNSTEIKNLLLNALYTVRVAAVTSRGIGNWSDSKSITTIKGKVIQAPNIHIDSYDENSLSFTLTMDGDIKVNGYVVNLFWSFDAHKQEKKTLSFRGGSALSHRVSNLTAHTSYEISAWAKTDLGDSPLAFEHILTRGSSPPAPSLKAKAINQTAVECIWTGPKNVVYGIFYATSFLDLYRNPKSVTTSLHNKTVIVSKDEQYLFLVRVLIPYQGPSSDYVVVKMIPDSRLPPRHLHAVHIGKTSALIKWESPYDSPDQDLFYAIAVKDLIRKTDRSYKVRSRNSTVEYSLSKLEPGGKYHIIVQLGNMSKDSSIKITTVSLSAPDALKIITENDHVLLFWKSLALKEKQFNETRGYEIHMSDSAVNLTAYLGNTTDNFFKVSNLKMGHNYTFTVQARCLFGSQICGEPAVLLYDELSSGADAAVIQAARSTDVAAVVVPILFLILLSLGVGFAILYTKHRRLQSSFSAFANSHYSSRLGSAIFSSGDDLGEDDEDAPMITGFSDDVPMVIA